MCNRMTRTTVRVWLWLWLWLWAGAMLLPMIMSTDAARPRQDAHNEGARDAPSSGCDRRVLFIVPHAHCDVGWLQTYASYLKLNVTQILDGVHAALIGHPQRRFSWAEMAFFAPWFERQTKSVQSDVRALSQRGALEFVEGGWVQPDEGATTVEGFIEQLAEGHRFLAEAVGPWARPRVGWQIDAFGASASTPYLMSLFGLEAVVLNRVPDDAYDARRYSGGMEFWWAPSASSPGAAAPLLAHILDSYFCYPTGFLFEPQRWDMHPPGPTDPPVTPANVQQRAQALVDAVADRWQAFRTPYLLVPWGCDFQYQDAGAIFASTDLLVAHIAAHADAYNTTARYATVSEYFDAVRTCAATQTALWDTYHGDFLPYWAGTYTSRPLIKLASRRAEALLRAADIALSRAGPTTPYEPTQEPTRTARAERALQMDAMASNTTKARRNNAVVMHHDAITGTSCSIAEGCIPYGQYGGQHDVVEDYLRLLNESAMLSRAALWRTMWPANRSSWVQSPRARADASSAPQRRLRAAAFQPLAWPEAGRLMEVAVPPSWPVGAGGGVLSVTALGAGDAACVPLTCEWDADRRVVRFMADMPALATAVFDVVLLSPPSGPEHADPHACAAVQMHTVDLTASAVALRAPGGQSPFVLTVSLAPHTAHTRYALSSSDTAHAHATGTQVLDAFEQTFRVHGSDGDAYDLRLGSHYRTLMPDARVVVRSGPVTHELEQRLGCGAGRTAPAHAPDDAAGRGERCLVVQRVRLGPSAPMSSWLAAATPERRDLSPLASAAWAVELHHAVAEMPDDSELSMLVQVGAAAADGVGASGPGAASSGNFTFWTDDNGYQPMRRHGASATAPSPLWDASVAYPAVESAWATFAAPAAHDGGSGPTSTRMLALIVPKSQAVAFSYDAALIETLMHRRTTNRVVNAWVILDDASTYDAPTWVVGGARVAANRARHTMAKRLRFPVETASAVVPAHASCAPVAAVVAESATAADGRIGARPSPELPLLPANVHLLSLQRLAPPFDADDASLHPSGRAPDPRCSAPAPPPSSSAPRGRSGPHAREQQQQQGDVRWLLRLQHLYAAEDADPELSAPCKVNIGGLFAAHGVVASACAVQASGLPSPHDMPSAPPTAMGSSTCYDDGIVPIYPQQILSLLVTTTTTPPPHTPPEKK